MASPQYSLNTGGTFSDPFDRANQGAGQSLGFTSDGSGDMPTGGGFDKKMVGQAIDSGLKGINKIVGTFMMMNEMEKNRSMQREMAGKDMALQKKALMLEYLLGNTQLTNKLKALNVKLSNSSRSRSMGSSSGASRAASRRVR